MTFSGTGTRPAGLVFQDPAGTLNPELTVRRTLKEAIRGGGTSQAPERLLELVSLPSAVLGHRPAALCDEAVSALDVSVQAEILALLERPRDEHGQTVLFISHDLAVIGQLCDRVIVLNEGAVVEEGETSRVLADPSVAYTRTLVAAGRGANRPPAD